MSRWYLIAVPNSNEERDTRKNWSLYW